MPDSAAVDGVKRHANFPSNLVTNAIVAISLPTIPHSLSVTEALAVFRLFASIAFTVVYRYTPETKVRQPEGL